MSEKELTLLQSHWLGLLAQRRRMVGALLILLALMWVTPLGLKWVLVSQLQRTLKREVTVHAVQLHPLSLSLSVDGLSIKNAEGAEFLGWQRLTVDVSAKSITQHAWVLDALTLQSPRVSVAHLGQGRFDFSDLLVSDKPESSVALPPFVLREVSISDGCVNLDDRPFQRMHTLENVNFTLPMVSNVFGNHGVSLLPELSATLNGAPLHVSGGVQPLADVPDGALALSVDAFDLTTLQAYLPSTWPLRLVSGKLSTDLKILFSQVAGDAALLVNGTVQLQDVAINDVRERALLSFKTLALSLSTSNLLAGPVMISNVTLDDPQAALRIHTDGQVNWVAALPPAQLPQSKPAAANKAFAVKVDRLTLTRGVVDFADASVTPVVQTRISDMNAVMKNISTQPGTQADVALKATIASTAPLQLQARLQPLDVTAFMDAKLQTTGVDLTRFSGYAKKYLGYPINKGKLSVNASYRIQNKQLQADHHVVIDHLTLGEQVSSPHAVDAPVSLGVSLLKNSSGQIDIDLPVSGAVDAPEFSFGGLVAQTIGNTLLKVVTAPVRAVGSLLGSEDKED